MPPSYYIEVGEDLARAVSTQVRIRPYVPQQTEFIKALTSLLIKSFTITSEKDVHYIIINIIIRNIDYDKEQNYRNLSLKGRFRQSLPGKTQLDFLLLLSGC